MPIPRSLANGLIFLFLASTASPLLDQPGDAEATAAVRAMNAMATGHRGRQEQIVHIETCRPAVGRPGVLCEATVKQTAQERASRLDIHFARGPDSAWVADVIP